MKLNLLLSLLFPITSVLIPLAIQAQDNPALEVESFDEFLFPDLDDTEMNLDTPSLNQPQFNPQVNPTSGEITPIASGCAKQSQLLIQTVSEWIFFDGITSLNHYRSFRLAKGAIASGGAKQSPVYESRFPLSAGRMCGDHRSASRQHRQRVKWEGLFLCDLRRILYI